MAHKIGIYYDEQGIRNIMKGPEIQSMEREIMQQKLSQIQADFFQHFGFQGNFALKVVMTNSKRSRASFRLVANDSRTTAALKREPGWLAKFI